MALSDLQIAAARKAGVAIARDVIADDMPRAWSGLDPQDGDILTAAGIEPGTPEWDTAETIAKEAYTDAIGTTPHYHEGQKCLGNDTIGHFCTDEQRMALSAEHARAIAESDAQRADDEAMFDR